MVLEKNTVTVTCVIPSLNQGEFIEKTILSALRQEGIKDLEMIVMDGGSTDETLTILKKYQSSFSFWKTGTDDGQAAAVNEGVKKGTGMYVCWLNSDDLFLPGGLKCLCTFLESHPQYVAVHGKAKFIDEDGNETGDYPSSVINRKTLQRTCPICQPATLIRRSVWDAVGGLDRDLSMCLDYDLWWRLLAVGKIGYLDDYVACSRLHHETKTVKFKKQHYREAFWILRKNTGKVPFKWRISALFEELFACSPSEAKFHQKLRVLLMLPFYYWKNRS